MNYIDKINEILQPAKFNSPFVVDLFAGCGDLSLGF
jgi:16S rRNA G966 N2-methylase RsmD